MKSGEPYLAVRAMPALSVVCLLVVSLPLPTFGQATGARQRIKRSGQG
jgi:hypothetical protein